MSDTIDLDALDGSDPFWTTERIESVRDATPGTNTVTHLNNAGAALVSATVHQAVVDHLELEAAIGGYEAAEAAEPQIDRLYVDAAALLGAQPSELAVVESATRAWSSAFSALTFSPGDRVITSASEYASNVMGLLRARDRDGIEIDLAPADSTGAVDPDAVAALIGPRTRAISLTHCPTQGGLVQPAATIGRIAKENDLLYLVDACQSVGQLAVDVHELNADMLSFTGRKFLRAPRGTGMLWVGKHALEHFDKHVGMDMANATWTSPTTVELAPTARRFTPFELPIPAVVGMGQAFAELQELGITNIEWRVTALAEHLRNCLSELDAVEVHDLGTKKSGIVTFTKAGFESSELKASLRQVGINVSVTAGSSAQYDLPGRGLTDMVRASVHYYNTLDDIERLIEHVAAA